MVGTCLLSAEGREPGCLGALTSLLPTGLRAAAGAVPEEHGVEILPEHQPRMEAAGMGLGGRHQGTGGRGGGWVAMLEESWPGGPLSRLTVQP